VSAGGPKNNRNLVLLPLLPVGGETVRAAARNRLRPIGCTTKGRNPAVDPLQKQRNVIFASIISCDRPRGGAAVQPRPIWGIWVAITVMNCTLASSGMGAM
jgi:hypothetical protein